MVGYHNTATITHKAHKAVCRPQAYFGANVSMHFRSTNITCVAVQSDHKHADLLRTCTNIPSRVRHHL